LRTVGSNKKWLVAIVHSCEQLKVVAFSIQHLAVGNRNQLRTVGSRKQLRAVGSSYSWPNAQRNKSLMATLTSRNNTLVRLTLVKTCDTCKYIIVKKY